jgi:hypothetical protein
VPFEKYGVSISKDAAKKQLYSNGISYFWLHFADDGIKNKFFPYVNQYQDSSVVVLNRKIHSRTLDILTELIVGNFDLGYGDKEFFWFAATISNVTFAFEPHLSGHYGDCFGMILHFDPNDSEPLFMNAEYLVEDDLRVLGQFLQDFRTKAILLAGNALPNVSAMNGIWSKGGKDHPSSGCVCSASVCTNIEDNVTTLLLFSQWITLSMKFKSNVDECIPVFVSRSTFLKVMFQLDNFREDCYLIGCPNFPYDVDVSNPSWNSSWPQYCEPISFTNQVNESVAKEARSPTSLWNKRVFGNNSLIQCGTSQTIYTVANYSVLHAIPNVKTFLSLGRDFSEVHRISPDDCGRLYSFAV